MGTQVKKTISGEMIVLLKRKLWRIINESVEIKNLLTLIMGTTHLKQMDIGLFTGSQSLSICFFCLRFTCVNMCRNGQKRGVSKHTMTSNGSITKSNNDSDESDCSWSETDDDIDDDNDSNNVCLQFKCCIF
jgi:hypothetical protein